MKTRYSAKRSSSFGIFLLIISILILFAGIGLPLMLVDEFPAVQWIIMCLIIFPIIGMFIWSWTNTYYLIDHEVLVAKSGPIFRKVPVKEISIIRLNQKTIGGTWKLTLSWNSIEIVYKNYSSIFITPEKQGAFIEHLKSINADIEVKQS